MLKGKKTESLIVKGAGKKAERKSKLILFFLILFLQKRCVFDVITHVTRKDLKPPTILKKKNRRPTIDVRGFSVFPSIWRGTSPS